MSAYRVPRVSNGLGEVAVDDRLPGELELAEQYGVSRDTIRRAIQELVTSGRLVVLHGRGTFVKPQSLALRIIHAGGSSMNVRP